MDMVGTQQHQRKNTTPYRLLAKQRQHLVYRGPPSTTQRLNTTYAALGFYIDAQKYYSSPRSYTESPECFTTTYATSSYYDAPSCTTTTEAAKHYYSATAPSYYVEPKYITDAQFTTTQPALHLTTTPIRPNITQPRMLRLSSTPRDLSMTLLQAIAE